MSKCIDLWEDYSAMSYMVEELSKEMATMVKLAMKPIHERIDRIAQRKTENFHHPTMRAWRSLNEEVHKLSNDEGGADQEKPSEEEPDEEEIEALGEHMLVSNQALNVKIHLGEEEKQENILHMKSNVKDEVCSMIIDGGTCTNDVSTVMVEIAGLPILNYPKCYNLQLRHKSVNERVDMQLKLPLDFSKYEDPIKLQKKKKMKKKKLKERDIMHWSFIARIEGFVFDPGIDDSDLRTNPLQEEGNDAAQGSLEPDPVRVPVGPITRSRAKKFKETLMGLIQEVQKQELSKRPIGEEGMNSPNIINLIQAIGPSLEDM